MGISIFDIARKAQEASVAQAALAAKMVDTVLEETDTSLAASRPLPNQEPPLVALSPVAPPPVSGLPTVVLNEKQRFTVDAFCANSHGALIGYAGTGKTTTVKQAIERITASMEPVQHDWAHLRDVGLPAKALPFVMCAFTGMAVKAMRRSVGVQSDFARHCFTIHKLLDYGPVEKEVMPSPADILKGAHPHIPIIKKMMLPRRNRLDPLTDLKIVVIDEVSMLSVSLWNELCEALPDDCRVYIIGDIAQLPPVFGSSVMPHLASAWPAVELTEIYRQKDGSMIDNANRIRAGQPPVTSDMFRMGAIDADATKAQSAVLKLITDEFNSGRYDPAQDCILCTNNVGPVGQEMLNVLLRERVNLSPDPVVTIGTMRSQKRFKVGDRVMNTKNNADLGIYNGMLGWVRAINVNPSMVSEAIKLNGTTMTSGERAADRMAQNTADHNDLLSVLQEMSAEQEKRRAQAALDREFGRVTLVDDTDDDGTASRQATHSIVVEFDDSEELVVLGTSSQIENLIPAWAITVHKAQGSGFRHVYIVLHNAGGQLLTNELLYTAVTRCVETVTVLTTRYAWQKALNTQRISGRTLEEKLRSYLTQYGGRDDKALSELRVPRNQLLTKQER